MLHGVSYAIRLSVPVSTVSRIYLFARNSATIAILFEYAPRTMADPSKAQEPIASHRESEHVDDTDTAKIEAAVDTVHNDEAMKVLASYSGPQDWTEEEEKVVRRKIDKRLLWILCVTYGLQYVAFSQKSNPAMIGTHCLRCPVTELPLLTTLADITTSQCSLKLYAVVPLVARYLSCLPYIQAIFGLRTDLDLTGDRYSMSASIFYLGFIGGS